MADSTTIFTPESNGGSIPAWMAMNNGFGNGFGGLGGGILGFLLGLFFGNGNWGGFGNGFGGNGAGAAGFLSNQMNNDNGRDLLMSAITSNGEASRSAIENLANTLGQDFNLVNSGVQGIRDAVGTLSAQTGMSALQIVNAIQAGNAELGNRLASCCCEMKNTVTTQGYENQIATLNQTNTLSNAIASGNQRIVDAIADLKTTTVSEFCAARERDMQSEINRQAEIITQLRNAADNAAQTAQVSAMLNPIYAQITTLANKIPNTVPVVWPNLEAVQVTPTTPTNG